ncbi:MAG TPA: response regulator transcription factor [Brumimicrobium sp.]|nr:response regulator transcription factor [Brumimicrobium sp.]
MEETKLNILLVDDHEILLEGLENHIKMNFPSANTFKAKNIREIYGHLNEEEIDVILLDLILGDEDARMFLPQIIKLSPNVKIVVLSSLEEITIVRSLLQNGAHGFVGKSCSSEFITTSIKEVLKGNEYVNPELSSRIARIQEIESKRIGLSEREEEVLKGTLKGLTIKEIAEELNLSSKTVEYHRSNLFSKFAVRNATELVKKSILLGF